MISIGTLINGTAKMDHERDYRHGIRIASLSDDLDPALFGNKAAQLSRLRRAGYNVPDGVCVGIMPLETAEGLLRDPGIKRALIERIDPFKGEDGRYSVAVRSSANVEDEKAESNAGIFSTFLGQFDDIQLLQAIREVALGQHMEFRVDVDGVGIIVQELVTGPVSGIAFSSHPVSGAKAQSIVTTVKGGNLALTSGASRGQTITVDHKHEYLSFDENGEELLTADEVKNLARLLKRMESELQMAVDVEWVMDLSRALRIVQCRPIVFPTSDLFVISRDTENRIPGLGYVSTKVALQIRASRHAVGMGRCRMLVDGTGDTSPLESTLDRLDESPDAAGYSVVLVHPETLDGKVQRAFVGDIEEMLPLIERCERYAIRDFPAYRELGACVSAFLSHSRQESWYSIVLIHEILLSEKTGIIAFDGSLFIVEIAFGHFVPKGIVTTSRYIVSRDGEIVERHELKQHRSYGIINGSVLIEDVKGSIPRLDPDVAQELIQIFNKVAADGEILEFGIGHRCAKATPRVHLIDLVAPLDGGGEVSADSELAGIVSGGMARGRVVRVELSGAASTHLHHLDLIDENSLPDQCESLVYVADRPDISLRALIPSRGRGSIAFIFNQGSILCHLAILLRERNVPAVIWPGSSILKDGDMVSINATRTAGNDVDRVWVID